MDHYALFDELLKLSAVSDEQARRALDQLDALEKNKPTVGQMGRYAAVGAVAAPVIGALGDVIYGGPKAVFGGAGHRLRGALGSSVKGALGASAIPMARTALDRQASMGQLRKYMKERTPE